MTGPSFWELARQALSSTERGYDLLAPKFEFTDYATPEPWIEIALETALSQYPDLKSGKRGADLACGTGRACRLLSQYCERVSGFDFSSNMLQQAARLSESTESIEWHRQDLRTLKLEEDSFDWIVTFGAWGHILPDFRVSLLHQVLSSLRAGGVFCTILADRAYPWQKRYWYHLGFDIAIRLRNVLWPREFHMYYGLNCTDSVLTLLSGLVEEPIAYQIRLQKQAELHPDLTILTVHRRSKGT